MDRAIRFYRDGLGWQTPSKEGDDWTIFKSAGTRLSLYERDKLARDIGPDVSPGEWNFGGITLAHNARSREDVDAILLQAERVGGRILKPAQIADWGGYSGYFADLDGYAWEIAWSKNNRFDEQGTLWGGPLGDPPPDVSRGLSATTGEPVFAQRYSDFFEGPSFTLCFDRRRSSDRSERIR